MLQLISHELDKNHINNIILTGSASNRAENIHRFKTDPRIRVLILSSRVDSSGLTLHVAKHIILVEPSLSRSLEAQSIKRAHRIGQRFTCYVHKFIVADSIEDKIMEQQYQSMLERRSIDDDDDDEEEAEIDGDTMNEQENEDTGDPSNPQQKVYIKKNIAKIGGSGSTTGREVLLLRDILPLLAENDDIYNE